MAIRALIGFDHLEGVTAWGALLDSGLTFNTPTPNQPVAGGYLGVSTAGVPQYTLSLDVASLLDAGATKYVVGMRAKTWSVGALNEAAPSMGPGWRATARMDALAGAYAPLVTLNASVYLEYEVDLVTGVVRRWVDNVETTSVTIPVADVMLFRIQTGFGSYSTWRMVVRDLYVVDNVATADDVNVSRLGPQLLIPIVSSAADGPNWTVNAGTLLGALNPANAEAPITNKATSPLTRDPLTLTLSAAIPAGAVVNGISLTMGGKSLGSGPAPMGSKLIVGASEKVGKTPSVPQTQSYANGFGIFAKAPGGSAWSNANLNGAKLVISPDVAG